MLFANLIAFSSYFPLLPAWLEAEAITPKWKGTSSVNHPPFISMSSKHSKRSFVAFGNFSPKRSVSGVFGAQISHLTGGASFLFSAPFIALRASCHDPLKFFWGGGGCFSFGGTVQYIEESNIYLCFVVCRLKRGLVTWPNLRVIKRRISYPYQLVEH